ncbi:MAG: tryptophan 2,3-dioxygenase [Deltaproteobacteria bacterium]|nr:tryptophan 2,3-dioxygenase [Deltaproteobacteria bacterium]
MSAPNTPTYWDYLGLEQLLSLQGGLEGDETRLMPDELHFIVVHQVFELWFKLILREVRLARDHLAAPVVPEEHVPYVVHHLRRVNTIAGLMVAQFGVMETLTPQDFLDFRAKLVPASGFQSFQMREVEILLGLTAEQRTDKDFGDPLAALRRFAEASPGGKLAIDRIVAVQKEHTLREALHAWLHRTPIQGSTPDEAGDDAVVTSFIDQYLAKQVESHRGQRDRIVEVGALPPAAADAKFAAAQAQARSFLMAEEVDPGERARTRRTRAAILFIESYRELPLLAWPRLLLDTVVELESSLVLFRTRHARMVERVIGRRLGTGGSAGVAYLDRTAENRIFTELWAVRTMLLPRVDLPSLQRREDYGFA